MSDGDGNVDAVRRLLDALAARDPEGIAAELHPEVEAQGAKGHFTGVDAVVGWAKPNDRGHLVSRVEVDEIRPIGDHHVAVAARRQWRWKVDGRVSDRVADEAPFAFLFEFRDARIHRWRQNFASIIDAIDAIPAQR